jgi:hypothetical protein
MRHPLVFRSCNRGHVPKYLLWSNSINLDCDRRNVICAVSKLI